MYLAKNRRSWQMLFPHIGEVFAPICFCRNSMVCSSATLSVIFEFFTLSIKPYRPLCLWFQSSIEFIIDSDWWTAIIGPSAIRFKLGSVTRVAISMMRSFYGSSPVISKSIQIRFNAGSVIFCLESLSLIKFLKSHCIRALRFGVCNNYQHSHYCLPLV